MRKLFTLSLALFALTLATGSAKAISLEFDLQPIRICESGACQDPLFDNAYLNAIFNQIDIGVNVLPTEELTTADFARNTDGDILAGPAIFSFANQRFGLGIDPNTVYMGFTDELESTVLGIAFEDAPFFPFGLVENFAALDNPTNGALIRGVTSVLAHEIGHVLGGDHALSSPGTLMEPFINLSLFNDPNFILPFSQANTATIIDSPLLREASVSAVPVPAALPLMILALISIFGIKRARFTLSVRPPAPPITA